MLAAAVAACAGAVALGESDLLRVAIVILVVCLLSWLLWRLLPLRLSVRQPAHPVSVTTGSRTEIAVQVRVRHALLPSSVICRELTSAGLTDAGQLAVLGRRAAEGLTLRYGVSARARGAHVAGPLEVTLRDPLGLVTVSRRTTGTVEVLGLPRCHAVHPGWLRVAGGIPSTHDLPEERGDSREPDVGVREHRPEDGLRRIHWRSSARTGRLMARLDEPVATRIATIAYESRAEAHRGSSFENTVEIVASLAVALLRAGYELRLVDSSGTTSGFTGPAELLRFLALATPTTGGSSVGLPGGEGPALLVCTSAPLPEETTRGLVIVVEQGPARAGQPETPGLPRLRHNGRPADLLSAAPEQAVRA